MARFQFLAIGQAERSHSSLLVTKLRGVAVTKNECAGRTTQTLGQPSGLAAMLEVKFWLHRHVRSDACKTIKSKSVPLPSLSFSAQKRAWVAPSTFNVNRLEELKQKIQMTETVLSQQKGSLLLAVVCRECALFHKCRNQCCFL